MNPAANTFGSTHISKILLLNIIPLAVDDALSCLWATFMWLAGATTFADRPRAASPVRYRDSSIVMTFIEDHIHFSFSSNRLRAASRRERHSS